MGGSKKTTRVDEKIAKTHVEPLVGFDNCGTGSERLESPLSLVNFSPTERTHNKRLSLLDPKANVVEQFCFTRNKSARSRDVLMAFYCLEFILGVCGRVLRSGHSAAGIRFEAEITKTIQEFPT